VWYVLYLSKNYTYMYVTTIYTALMAISPQYFTKFSMSESSLESRLSNCCEKITENIEILNSYMTDDHIVDCQKLISIAQSIDTANISQMINACENTKRSVDCVLSILNYEKRRRDLSSCLDDKQQAREKKMMVKNKSRKKRRDRFNPYRVMPSTTNAPTTSAPMVSDVKINFVNSNVLCRFRLKLKLIRTQ